jgi:hypothetical protein
VQRCSSGPQASVFVWLSVRTRPSALRVRSLKRCDRSSKRPRAAGRTGSQGTGRPGHEDPAGLIVVLRCESRSQAAPSDPAAALLQRGSRPAGTRTGALGALPDERLGYPVRHSGRAWSVRSSTASEHLREEGVLLSRLRPCSGGRACATALRGAKRSDSRGHRAALPKSVQAAAPPPKAPALAQACRKRRPRSPRSPALGRTHNDGAPVLKLGQGLFSEIATFTIESGPTPLGALLDSSLLYRETVLLNDADTHEPNANRCMAISRAKSGRDSVCALRQNGFIRAGSTLVV